MRSSNIDYAILCICNWKRKYLVENNIYNNKHIQNIFCMLRMLANNLESEPYITLDIVIVYGNETSNETYFKIFSPETL